MADRVVPMDVRSMVVAWPEDAPRGAVARFVREHGVSRSWFYDIRSRARLEGTLAALQPRPRLGPRTGHGATPARRARDSRAGRLDPGPDLHPARDGGPPTPETAPEQLPAVHLRDGP